MMKCRLSEKWGLDGKRHLSVIANLPKEFYHEKSPAIAGPFAIKTTD